jgi:ketosteroid isomerase-like protein
LTPFSPADAGRKVVVGDNVLGTTMFALFRGLDMQIRTVVVASAMAGALIVAPVEAQTPSPVNADVQKVVDAFHAGLKTGDTAGVMSLLASDALLLEAGGIETRAEYESKHLPADVEFEKSVTTSVMPYRVTVVGDAAWAVSTSEYKGTFRERPVDSVGVELMILSREAAGWRIRAIHWSSRARRPPQ